MPVDGVPCPTCDRSFDTDRGMKIHHSRKHDESIGRRKSGDHPCPKEDCQRRFDTRQGMKTHHAQTHDESISGVWVECENCGSEKRTKPSYAEKREMFFCDDDCAGEWRKESGVTREKNNPRWKEKTEVSCDNCGDSKYLNPWEVEEDKENRFCDYNCLSEYRSENFVGENHPCWQGGTNDHQDYGENWQDRRQETLEDDCYTCQSCGDDSEQVSILHVHHVIPYEAFEEDALAHRDENLVTLCASCHRKWEGIPLRPILI